LVHAHELFREDCVNLVAAENVMSGAARQLLSSEIVHRYGDYAGRDLRARKYLGTRYIVEIEEDLDALLRDLFDVAFVEPRALSGHVAGVAATMAFTRPGDVVFELDGASGGHRIAEKLNATHYAALEVYPLPFDAAKYNVDVERTVALARDLHPRIVILGSSLFLFPHPVAELAHELAGSDCLIAYDASHVLGLIAGREFQDPLREGAQVVWSSTHKSFPGPPGGIVLTQSEDVIRRASEAIYPGLVTNHHPGRMASLALATTEMLAFGSAYASAIVANAQRLAAELAELGMPVVGASSGFTRSHTVLLAVAEFGTAQDLGQRLEEAGIITTASRLPDALGRTAIRLGVQEATRRGMTGEDMATIAGITADVIAGRRSPDEVRPLIRTIARDHRVVRYSFDWQELVDRDG
jgi:glycine hydroxymethyltransferase